MGTPEAAAAPSSTRLEIDGGVAVLTIDRSPANALDAGLVAEIGARVQEAVLHPQARALVITGTGTRFVAGADIKMLRTVDAQTFVPFISAIQRVFDDLEAAPLPTIAAINGHAMGGGLELALACDLRIAAEGVRLGLPEVKLGLLPGAGGTQRLVETIGRGRALEMLLTGAPVDTERALALGLVNRVLAADALLDGARQLAADLAAGAGEAQREIKACVLAHTDGGRRAGSRAEAVGVAHLIGTADAQEGIAAFLDKRAAVFGRAG